jgi:hypothetical protein
MVFNKASLVILLALTWAVPAEAQTDTRCALASSQFSQAPELKGLWPGMTVEQVKAVVPSLEMGERDGTGLSKTSFSPDFNPKIDKTAFQGVRTVSLDFLDGRLFSLWLGYNETFKLKTADELARAITRSLKMTGAWETKGRGQQLLCSNYQLVVTMVGGSPTLRITDETIREAWEKRRTEVEEQEP